ncbi:hydrogenase maturation protein HypF, partial [Klebsiella pneumoniae]
AMARDCATVRGIDTMVCSGGVLHNRLLAARLTFIWRIYSAVAQQLPAGDNG